MKKTKINSTFLTAAKSLFVLLLLASCAGNTESKRPLGGETSELTQQEMIKRGKYLTTIAGCNDCHSPKIMTPHGLEPDTTRMLSGHPGTDALPPLVRTNDWVLFNIGLTAFVGPWGVSYAANLTPDETGIGNWDFEQFETAIRKGKYKGLENSRPLLPPMPWQMYRNMTNEDLRSVFAYLKSLPAIRNVVPAPQSPQRLNELASK
jgi:hypothetical protein